MRPAYYAKLLASMLSRKKTVDEANLDQTELKRCLNTIDLTALGVGSTLGAGVYVIAGEVAQKTTGPAVVISFFIAAAASVLAGLCYAEFGARVPKSGSAYVYSYVSVGELMAFVIGWNLILEYVIGTASVARAWSQNFDSLVGGKIINFFRDTMSMHVTGIAEYPDFFALAIVLLLTVIIAIGVKESAWVTNVFTFINLIVLVTVFITGCFLSSFGNWSFRPNENGTLEYNNVTYTPGEVGSGGFLPFGLQSVISGAGTCFYAFVGFDAIATTGEEVKNPQRAIPISIIVSLAICFVAYCGVSAVLTLMEPYFALDPLAPLPKAFASHGWVVANYVIAVGAVCALSTSLLGAMFPLPRVVYAMASDGLVFRFMSRVEPRLGTPLIATLLTGAMAGIMACLFELKELVDMMSIGTLLAYTLVALSVLILRGSQDRFNHDTAVTSSEAIRAGSSRTTSMKAVLVEEEEKPDAVEADYIGNEEFNTSDGDEDPVTMARYLRSCFPRGGLRSQEPTGLTEKITRINSTLFMVAAGLLAFVLERLPDRLAAAKPEAIIPAVVAFIFCILTVVSLGMQPQSPKKVAFKVPWVPVLPCLSIFVNLYLMTALSESTWVRFVVWSIAGFIIYFSYGLLHSTEHAIQTRPTIERDAAAAAAKSSGPALDGIQRAREYP